MDAKNALAEQEIACECPGRPHDKDIVFFKPALDMEMGLAAYSAFMNASPLIGDRDAATLSSFLRHGIVGWTCRDEDGELALTPGNMQRRFGWGPSALAVTKKAMELYYGPFWAAFPSPNAPSPESGLSKDSTSASPASGPASPSSRKPSSPSPAAPTT